jgi:hypothetical protein
MAKWTIPAFGAQKSGYFKNSIVFSAEQRKKPDLHAKARA